MDVKDIKSRVCSSPLGEARWVGCAPHLRVTRKGCPVKRGSAQNPGARLKSLLQRIMSRRGRDKPDIPGCSAGHLGARGAGRSAPPLPAEKEPCKGRDEEGRARRAKGDTPGPRDAPWGCGLARRARWEEGQGLGEPAGSDGGRTGRRRASRGRGRWGLGGGGTLTRCGSSSGSAGGGGSSGGNSSGSASSTAPPSLRRLLRLRSPPPPTTTFGDVTPVT